MESTTEENISSRGCANVHAQAAHDGSNATSPIAASKAEINEDNHTENSFTSLPEDSDVLILDTGDVENGTAVTHTCDSFIHSEIPAMANNTVASSPGDSSFSSIPPSAQTSSTENAGTADTITHSRTSSISSAITTPDVTNNEVGLQDVSYASSSARSDFPSSIIGSAGVAHAINDSHNSSIPSISASYLAWAYPAGTFLAAGPSLPTSPESLRNELSFNISGFNIPATPPFAFEAGLLTNTQVGDEDNFLLDEFHSAETSSHTMDSGFTEGLHYYEVTVEDRGTQTDPVVVIPEFVRHALRDGLMHSAGRGNLTAQSESDRGPSGSAGLEYWNHFVWVMNRYLENRNYQNPVPSFSREIDMEASLGRDSNEDIPERSSISQSVPSTPYTTTADNVAPSTSRPGSATSAEISSDTHVELIRKVKETANGSIHSNGNSPVNSIYKCPYRDCHREFTAADSLLSHLSTCKEMHVTNYGNEISGMADSSHDADPYPYPIIEVPRSLGDMNELAAPSKDN
ncbi:hypothetical protein RUND412_009412 [Rhizina undulata]